MINIEIHALRKPYWVQSEYRANKTDMQAQRSRYFMTAFLVRILHFVVELCKWSCHENVFPRHRITHMWMNV